MPSVVSGGTLVTLQGTNMRPNDRMVFYLRDPAKPTEPILQIGTTETSAAGGFVWSFTYPNDARWTSIYQRQRDRAVDGHGRLSDGAFDGGSGGDHPHDCRAYSPAADLDTAPTGVIPTANTGRRWSYPDVDADARSQ